MQDRQKVEAILTSRFPGAPLPQVAAAVNAIMALDQGRPAPSRTTSARRAPETAIAVFAHIAAPLTRVFDRFTDIDRAPEYVSGIVAVSRLSDGPFAVGTRWRETRRLLGHLDSADMEVTAFAPYRGYTISHVKAGIRIAAAFSFEAAGSGTLVSIEFALDEARMPAAMLTTLNWAIAGKVRYVLHADLADLKAGLEGR